MKTRYVVVGDTRKLWSIVDTLPAGYKTIEYGIPRKWIAEARRDQLESHHMKQKYYCESVPSADGWRWKIYHYDESGNKELLDATQSGYLTKEVALDAATDWMDDNNIDAEIM